MTISVIMMQIGMDRAMISVLLIPSGRERYSRCEHDAFDRDLYTSSIVDDIICVESCWIVSWIPSGSWALIEASCDLTLPPRWLRCYLNHWRR
jgi:hypothetical protein